MGAALARAGGRRARSPGGRARDRRHRGPARGPSRPDDRAREPRRRRARHRAGRARSRARPALDARRRAGRDHGDRIRARLGDRASDEHGRPSGSGGAVKPRQTQLPKGARIYLPGESERKRHGEASLLGVFRRWGYREIVTPTFEYSDVLATGTGVDVQGNMFTLVDRETGRTLALRPDITPQIARVVATRLRDEPKPIRLAYVTNVFRYDEPRVSHYREFYQAGVELGGLDKPAAEAQIIAMAIEGLRALGLERFQIDLGHPDFFRGPCEDAGAEPARVRELRAALARKDASTLERIVSDLAPAPHVREALLALPTLFGHEPVPERARAFARATRPAQPP